MGDQNKQIQLDVRGVNPLFADEVVVASKIKSFKKEGSKQVEKEGKIELIFIDQLSQPARAISRIVVSSHTAQGLLKILNENLQKIEKDLKDKKMPKIKKEIHIKQEKNYFG